MSAEFLPETEPISHTPEEETCRACGACCIGSVRLPLSRKEAGMLRAHGTKLVQETYHGGREEIFSRDGACSFLEVATDGLYSCSLYGRPEMPRTCRVTVSEGNECGDLRDSAANFLLPDLVEILTADAPLDLEFGMLPE